LKANSLGEDSFDLTTGTVSIEKTLKTPSARRTVPIPSAALDYLKPRCNTAKIIALSRDQIYRRLAVLGVPAPHSFRRWFCTNRVQNKMHPEVLRYLLGHCAHGVTMRYYRTDEDFIKAEVNRVGLGFELEAT